MSSKDPWMPFYGTDFFEDPPVQAMTWEQRAIYLRLLWVAWREGSIPDDEHGLAALVSLSPARFRKVWPAIAVKWRPASPGRLVNDRLERVRGDRKERSEYMAALSAKGVEARRLNRSGNRAGDQDGNRAGNRGDEPPGDLIRIRVRDRVREASNLASSLSDARAESGSTGEAPDDPDRARQAAAAVARIAAKAAGESHGS